MFTIHLNNLRFHAHHGWHAEEHLLGNEYEINVAATFASEKKVAKLDDTVNYVMLYDVIKERMHVKTLLLETLAQDIANAMHTADQRITSVDITIKKCHPPIAHFSGAVSVSYKKEF
ncbi:MAG: dihydroneopterin aldolase [Bacteroidetes bacterium]|nr:dihydroneopterin aldolase [Bacteroidota bacterium]